MGIWMMILGSEILKDRGFTIVEVLIAMMIFSIALLALVSLATTSMKATEMGRRMTQGVNLATQKIESLKAVPFNDVNSDGNSGGIDRTCVRDGYVFTCTPTVATDTLDGMTFTWYWKIEYMDLDADGVYFNDAANPDDGTIDDGDIRLVTVVVSWLDIMGSHNTTLGMLRSKI